MSNKKRYLTKFIKGRDGERGATAVEFALLTPVFLVFVLGIMDFGRLFWIKNLMQFATGESARYVMVNPTVSKAALEAYAQGQVSTLFSGITFVADVPGTTKEETPAGSGNFVYYRTLTATYTFKYFTPFVVLSDIPLNVTITTPVNKIP